MNFKKDIGRFLSGLSLVLISLSTHAQDTRKIYTNEGTLTVDTASDRITILVDDEEEEYLFDPEVSFGKGISRQGLRVGHKLKISFYLEERQYKITELKLTSSKIDETITFTGLFEYQGNSADRKSDTAIVDGRKVVLNSKAALECRGKKLFKKDCGCEKVKPYKSLDVIKKGAYFTVTGKINKDGFVEASKITVCRNSVSDDEIELRRSIEKNFDSSNLVPIKKIVKTNPTLYRGKLKLGIIPYVLAKEKLQEYVNSIGDMIIPKYAKTDSFKLQTDINWRFFVVEDSIPNAFSFPNGMVFIYTGLLKFIENKDQLASVLSHEVAHVLYEHAVRRYSKNKYFDGGLVVSGWNKIRGEVKKLIRDTSNSIKRSVNDLIDSISPENLSGLFEKTKETQADRLGLMYMHRAGYNVWEASKLWLRIRKFTSDETFKAQMRKQTVKILQSKELKVDKNILKQIGAKGVEAVGGTLLDNIYASQPLSAERYDAINNILVTYYKDSDVKKNKTSGF